MSVMKMVYQNAFYKTLYRKKGFKNLLLISFLVLFFCISCATPIPEQAVNSMAYDCQNVDQKIDFLKREKGKNNKRILSTARSIIPVGVLAGIVQKNYFTHVSVATGSWKKNIDTKLVEMNDYMGQCV